MKVVAELETPAVTVNLDIMEDNIRRVQAHLARYGIANRPHIKTHKIPALGKLQIEKGARGITCQKLGEAEVKALEPKAYHLEHANGTLALHFRLPLEKPVLIDAKGFNFSIYDPSYFIGFDAAKTDPVKLSADAPKTCKISLGVPKQEAAEAKRLGEAFFEQLGNANIGGGIAKTATVECT